MNELLVFIILACIAVLGVVSRWIGQPYPIVFLLGGIALALIPGMPPVRLAPDLVFFVFLPPLIFGDGYVTDWRDFKRYLRPITLLATGLVVATSVTVAFVAHWLIGLPLAVGFVLGAILSPTDTVATDAIAEETGLPRRIEIVLGGESLVNDATGLVLFKFAVGAVMAGTFSFGFGLAQFAYVAIVGLAVGVVGGMVIDRVGRFLFERGLTDDVITTVITLASPYLVYLIADRLGASGVLAAAAGGIYLSRKGGGFYTAGGRIIGRSVWNTLFFVLNGALFIILGLQLRTILRELDFFPVSTLALYGGSIALTVILSRLFWVFVLERARHLLERNAVVREGPLPHWTWAFVLGWCGMRGIVSLAAALSIPETIPSAVLGVPGVPFPARDLIQFLTFSTILVTLLGQGFTLPLFIRAFEVKDPDVGDEQLELARLRISEAGLKCLEGLEPSFVSPRHWEIAGKLRSRYEEQMLHYRAHVDGAVDSGDREIHDLRRDMIRLVLAAERGKLADLRSQGVVSDAIYRRLQFDIDLEESRLETA
jgi:CPA1 family monovalent cation:H+ antiporter